MKLIHNVRMEVKLELTVYVLTKRGQHFIRRRGYLESNIFLPFTLFSNLLLPDDLPRRRPPQMYKPPTAEMIAYLDFSVSTTGMLTGVKVRCISSTWNLEAWQESSNL